MDKKIILYIIISFIISFLLVSIDLTNKYSSPQEVYHVYIKGKSLGLIKSKKNLESYIDKEQQSIKEKYHVKKVYAPDELDIEKEITYNRKILSTKKIYEKIKDNSPFTINGYTIKIKGLTKITPEGQKVKSKDNIIYSLNKKTFTKAVEKTVKAFITEEKYNAYKNNTQSKIKDTGSTIENLYIKNKVTIKESKVPVDKTIYTNEQTLTKYLLFGSLDKQGTYTVKDGDTIADVAFNNKMSTEEFLIINNKFKDENSLLFTGQVVKTGILHPQFDLVEEDNTISDQDVNYETETKQDSSQSSSYSSVEQAGVKGKNRVTQKIQKINGETVNVVTTNTEVLATPVKEVVVQGTKGSNSSGSYSGSGYGSTVATKGEWGWPATCTSISSPFGYRWGGFHDGTDIAGCGFGSNIFAAQSGTVVKVSSKNDNGNYIIIDHHNGYFSLYCHLSAQYVREGQNVTKGQVIGAMGQTGNAKGVQLHFAIWVGYPYYGGSVRNAMSFY